MNINVISLPKWSRSSLGYGKCDREIGVRPNKCQDSTLNQATAASFHTPFKFLFCLHPNQSTEKLKANDSDVKRTKKIYKNYTPVCLLLPPPQKKIRQPQCYSQFSITVHTAVYCILAPQLVISTVLKYKTQFHYFIITNKLSEQKRNNVYWEVTNKKYNYICSRNMVFNPYRTNVENRVSS